MRTYENGLSFSTGKRVLKFSFYAPRSQKVPLMEALLYLKRRMKKELWRKKMKEITGAKLLYIGQTGLDGDSKTKFFIIDPWCYSERQIEDVARWLYEVNARDLIMPDELTDKEYEELRKKITEINAVDLSDELSFILKAYYDKAEDKWFLESHNITNPQLMQMISDIENIKDLDTLARIPI